MGSYAPPFAAVATEEGLSIIYKSATDDTLWVSQSSADCSVWASPPTQLPTALTTNLAPSAAVWNGTIYVMYCSSANDGTLWLTTSDGSTLQQLPPAITTNSTPALVAKGPSLWAVFQSSVDLTMWVAQSSSDAMNWTLKQLPPTYTTQRSPVAAVVGDTVYVIFQSSSDNTLWITTSSDGDNWDLHQLPPAITSDGPPSITAISGSFPLCAAFMSSVDETMWISKATPSADGLVWDLHQLPTDATTLEPPVITSLNDGLFVLYKSSALDDTVWLISWNDSTGWSNPTQLPTTIKAGQNSEGGGGGDIPFGFDGGDGDE